MNLDQAKAAIVQLNDAFPNLTLTPGNVSYWANAITDYPADTVTPAIANLAHTETRISLAQLLAALTTERDRQAHRHRGHTHTDDLRRIDAQLADPNIDPEFRHTLEQERADVQRDTREAAQELQRDRDERNPDRPAHIAHLTRR